MIKIVTDASVNLPAEIVEAFDITLVPAYVIFGSEQLREAFDITTREVIARLDGGASFPKTSQPPPADFEAAYRRLLAQDPQATILSLHITGVSSGTVDSARRAAEQLADEFPQAVIHVFDTLAFSIAQALMVREAAFMAEVGEALDAILDRLRDMRDRVKTYFVLDTLDYVYRGGRIGRAAHLLGSLLNIKPVLTVHDGVLESYARFRTLSRALDALRELAIKACQGAQGVRIAIGHAMREEDAHRLADELEQAISPEVLLVSEVGPALGVYTGPRALGIAWYAPGG